MSYQYFELQYRLKGVGGDEWFTSTMDSSTDTRADIERALAKKRELEAAGLGRSGNGVTYEWRAVLKTVTETEL